MPTDIIRRAVTPVIRTAVRRFTPGSALRAIRQGELRPYPTEEGNLSFIPGAEIPIRDNEIVASFTSPALVRDPNRDNRFYLPGTLPLRDPNLRISYIDPNNGSLHVNEVIPENLDEARAILERKLNPQVQPTVEVEEASVAPVSNTSSQQLTGMQAPLREIMADPEAYLEPIESPGRELFFPSLANGTRSWIWDRNTGTMQPYREYERWGGIIPDSKSAIQEVLADAEPNDYITPRTYDLSTDSFLLYLDAIRRNYGTGRGQVTASIPENPVKVTTNILGDASVTWQDFINEVNKLPDSDALKQDIMTSITQHPEIAPHEWTWRNDVKDAQILDILTNLYNQKATKAMDYGIHSYKRLVTKDERLRPGLALFNIKPLTYDLGIIDPVHRFLSQGTAKVMYEYPQITATMHRRGGLFWPKNYK